MIGATHDVTATMGQTLNEALAADLLAAIERGEWRKGDTLPPERDLAVRFAVSRATVREALSRLERMGMLRRRPRTGTVVTATEPRRTYRQQIGAVEQLDDFSRATSMQVIDARPVTGEALATEYGLETAFPARLMRYTAVRSWRGETERISWNRVAYDSLYEGIQHRIGVDPKPTYRIIEEAFGVRVVGIDQEVRARLLGPEIARAMDRGPEEPALEVVRLMFRENGTPLMLAHSVHCASAITLRMHLGVDGLDRGR